MLFEAERYDLFNDLQVRCSSRGVQNRLLLQSLPRNAALRKLNDLIKRARLAKVHAYVIAELRKQMPTMIGKEKKKRELIANLDRVYQQLQVCICVMPSQNCLTFFTARAQHFDR